MILVVESGATKTDWTSTFGNCRTKGINPAIMSRVEILSVVSEARDYFSSYGGRIRHIYFYAAGLVSDKSRECVMQVLSACFPGASVSLDSDLMAASRALWGDGSGVVAILGTGSNSCLYENGRILKNVRPGGYILGDEGGGVCIGKKLLADYIKGLLPSDLKSAFEIEFSTCYEEIVANVYRGANPSGYLASFAPFILRRLDSSEYAYNITRQNLERFVSRSILQYRSVNQTINAGIVGSVGFLCRDLLGDIGKQFGIDFIKFIQSPGADLLNYHESRNFALKYNQNV